MTAGQVALHAADEVQEFGRFRTVGVGKDVLVCVERHHRMVGMCIALPGLAPPHLLHLIPPPSIGLAMKVGVGVVLQRRLADHALEEEHLVGQPHRIAVGAGFSSIWPAPPSCKMPSIFEAHGLGEIVDVVDDLAVFIDPPTWNRPAARRLACPSGPSAVRSRGPGRCWGRRGRIPFLGRDDRASSRGPCRDRRRVSARSPGREGHRGGPLLVVDVVDHLQGRCRRSRGRGWR